MISCTLVLIPIYLVSSKHYCHSFLREWSLIIRRGATKQEGGRQVKFYPYKKGDRNVLAMMKVCVWGGGGHNKF